MRPGRIRRGTLAVAGAIGAGLLLTAALYAGASAIHVQRLQGILEGQSRPVFRDIQKEVARELEVIYAGRSLFAASEVVERNEFRTFLTEVFRRHPDLAAVWWAPRLDGGRRGPFEEAAQAEGLRGYRLFDVDPSGRMAVSPPREEHHPVLFEEAAAWCLNCFLPADTAAGARRHEGPSAVPSETVTGGCSFCLGLDLAGDSASLTAITAARDGDFPVLLHPPTLGTGTSRSDRFAIALPVYRNGRPTGTVAERRRAHLGTILALVDLRFLMEEATGEGASPYLEILVLPDSRRGGGFLEGPGGWEEVPPGADLDRTLRRALEGFHWAADLEIADRTWSLFFHGTEAFEEAHRFGIRRFAVALGLLFTLLLFFMARRLVERHRVDAEIRRNEERFRQIAENVQEVLWLAEPDGLDLIYVSPAFASVWGRRPEEVLRNPAARRDWIHPDDIDRILAARGKISRGDFDEEYRIVRPDGEIRWIHDKAFPIRDDRGRVVRVAGIAEDITERMYRREARAAQEVLLARRQEALHALVRDPTLHGGDVTAAVRIVTEAAADVLGVARTSVWVFDEGRTLLRCLDVFERASGRHTGADPLRLSDAPTYFQAVEEGRILAAHDASHDPRTRDFAEAYLAPLGITSLLDATVRTGGRVVGVICHGHVGPPRRWTVEEQTLAASIADAFSLSLEAAERRKAEGALRESEEKYRVLVETTQTGFVVLDVAGRVLDANAEYARLAGRLTVAEILGGCVVDWTAPHDRARSAAAVRDCVARGFLRGLEVDYLRPGGGSIPVEIDATVVKTGAEMRIISLVRDISERRRAEEAHLRALVQHAFDVVMVLDADGLVTYLSPSAERVLGFAPEEILGTDAFPLVHPDDVPALRDALARSAAHPDETFTFEGRVRHKDGSWRFIDSIGVNIAAAGGDPRFVVNYRDVSERKRGEAALRESETKYRRLIEGLRQDYFFYRHGPDGVFTFLSRSITDVLGYTPEEFQSHYSTYLTDNPINDEVVRHTDESLRGIQQPSYEVEIKHKDGRILLLEVLETPVLDDGGRVVGVEGIAHDVTARRRAEETLRDAESRFRLILENALDGMAVADAETQDILHVNPAFCRMLGYAAGELVGRPVREVHPAFAWGEVEGYFRRIIDAGHGTAPDLPFRRKDGGTVLLDVNTVVLTLAGRRCLVGFMRDVTEQRRTEQALQESEERYRTTVENLTEGIYATRKGVLVHVNRAMSEIFGFDPAELVGRPAWDLAVPERRDEVRERFFRMVRECRYEPVEIECLRRDGTPILAEIRISGVTPDGEVFGLVIDVTERRKAEAALRESEERYRTLVENLNVGVYRNTGGPHGRFLFANSFIARMFGYDSVFEFMQVRVSDLYQDPADRTAFVAEVKRSGFVREFEIRLKKRDGTPIWCAVTAIPSFGRDGDISWMDGIIEDITHRKSAEEARMRTLVQHVFDVVLLLDSEGRGVYASPSVEKVFGYGPEERLGESIFGFVHPDDTDRAREAFGLALARRGETAPFEVRIRHKDGSWRSVEGIVADVADGDAPSKIVVNCRDITERKRGEEALRREKEFVDRVLDAQQDIVVIIDAKTLRIVRLNHRAVEVSGHDAAALTDMDLFQIHPSDQHDRVREAIAELLVTGRARGEIEVLARDDSRIPYEFSLSAISDEEGAPVFFCWVGRDVSERKLVEEVIRAERDRAQGFLDVAADIIVELDATGRIMLVNRAGGDVLGRPMEEILGRTWFDEFLPERTREEVRRTFDRLMAGDVMAGDVAPVEYYENPVITRGGEERTIAWHNVVLRGPDGRITGTLSAGIDVTERKRAEETLRESAYWLEESQRVSRLGSYVLDVRTGHWSSTKVLNDVLGITSGSPKTVDSWARLIHPEDRGRMMEYFRTDVLGMRRRFDREYRIVRPSDGEERWVHGLGEIILDEAGEPVRMAGTIQDVTDRHRSEEALRESERLLASLLGNLPGMAYRCRNDPNWTMEFVSEGCVRLTGYRVEEIIDNRRVSFNDLIHPEDRAPVWETVQEALRGRRSFVLLYRIHAASGEEKWVWEQGAGVFSKADELIALEGFIMDITARKRAEDDRAHLFERERHARAAAEAAVKARDVFLSIASHELKTPLTALLLQAQSLLRALRKGAGAPERLGERLENLERQGERMARLIDELLDVSRITAGLLDLRRDEVDLAALVQETVARHAEAAARDGCAVEVAAPAPVSGRWDRSRLEQVIANLLSNALKFGRGHPVRIEVSADGEGARLTVADEGPGVDPKHRERIFERFERGDAPRRTGGLGLGLFIVREIVRAHGGRIEVAGDPGRGAVFTVTLPPGPSEIDVKEAPSAESGSPSGTRAGAGAKAETVLVVEDDGHIRELLSQILVDEGYLVSQAADGREALEVLRRSPPPGLIVLDLVMPVMDGPALCAEMRRDPALASIPVVALSADGRVSARAQEIGAVGAVEKPIRAADLLDVVRRHIRRD